MPPSNTAAWSLTQRAKPLQVQPAPYTPPSADQIVVKNRAVAINPVDYLLQEMGNLVFTWVKYPFIFGCDLAGEVVEVGSDASSRFKIGDHVLAVACGADQDRNNPAEAAFQNYTVVPADLAAKIPANLSYEYAAVIPLGLATAASGLFLKNYLGLDLPTVPARPSTSKTLIVWGGSTSVGCNAIQLAVAAGYEVFSTASPRNFELLKKLGASQVFDYNEKTVAQDMISALKDKTLAGAIAIGPNSVSLCIDILSKTKGSKFVTDVSGPGIGPSSSKVSGLALIPIMAHFIAFSVTIKVKSMWTGVTTKFVYGSDLKKNEVGPAIFRDFLPKALETGQYICAPDPEVIGHGLEHIQQGYDLLSKGVSAKKIVVTL
ncbi:zinc-binding oxidoreductase CipB [Umbelopsis sp. PMI_123]|nr:zinc-binding oxidoreductase CipB [Umbelopsis sp. PMI_123]